MVFTLSGRHVLTAAKAVDLSTIGERLGRNLIPIPPERQNNFRSLPFVTQVSFSIPTGAETLALPPLPYPIVYAPVEVPPIEVRIGAIWTQPLHPLVTSFDFGIYPPLWDIYIYNILDKSGFLFPLAIPRSLSLTFSEGGEPLRVELHFLSSYVAVLGGGEGDTPLPPTDPAPPVTAHLRTVLSVGNDFSITHPRQVLSLNLSISNQLNAIHTFPADLWGSGDTHRRTPRLFSIGYSLVEMGMRTYTHPEVSGEEMNGKTLNCRLDCYDKEMETVLLSFKVKGVITSSRLGVEANQALIWDVSLSAYGTPTTPPVEWLL